MIKKPKHLPRDISPADARAMMDRVVVVDVREPDELKRDPLAVSGVRNVPLGEILRGGLPKDLAPARELLLVCRSGARSRMAAEQLCKQGYQTVYNLAGGMLAWNAAYPRSAGS